MTLEEMRAAGKRADAIEAAMSNLKEARRVLEQVNKFVKSGQVWRPELRLDDGKQSWNYDAKVTIAIAIPAGVIQQQAVYAVDAARREVIRLGGTLPS